jgi:hypothetical protein
MTTRTDTLYYRDGPADKPYTLTLCQTSAEGFEVIAS